MKVELDDLSQPAIDVLLEEHLQSMVTLSPPGYVHALDLKASRKPCMTFWSASEGSLLLGCGALKELAYKHGEIKAMRAYFIAPPWRGVRDPDTHHCRRKVPRLCSVEP